VRAVFRVDLRVPAGRVRLVLRRRLAGDFLVALPRVAAADLLARVERFGFARLLAAPLDVAFFLVERPLPR
jgi:hypothetical protein